MPLCFPTTWLETFQTALIYGQMWSTRWGFFSLQLPIKAYPVLLGGAGCQHFSSLPTLRWRGGIHGEHDSLTPSSPTHRTGALPQARKLRIWEPSHPCPSSVLKAKFPCRKVQAKKPGSCCSSRSPKVVSRKVCSGAETSNKNRNYRALTMWTGFIKANIGKWKSMSTLKYNSTS